MEVVVPKEFRSSRLTKGNFFFPDRVIIDDDSINFIKSKLIGKNEEIINFDQIASVKVNTRLIFGDVYVETSGGSQPIFINGLKKRDAEEIKNLVRDYLDDDN